MASHFALRLQPDPDRDAARVSAELLDLVQQATAQEVVLFAFAEDMNDGHPSLAEIEAWLSWSRPIRQTLQAAGVVVSLNPWQTLLHADRGRRLRPDQDWQTLVDARGTRCTACVCPLDPGWQQYFTEALNRYAVEGFDTIWIEDDIRLHNHAPLEWGGCFCPLHLALFAHRTAVAVTRQELVTRCTAPGPPHPWRGLWLDCWDDTLRTLVCGWRDLVEAQGGRLGLMSSGMDAHAAEGRDWPQWWTALGQQRPPVHRPHFWAYGDVMGPWLATGMVMLDQNRWIQSPRAECRPEVDSFPDGPWNRSSRQLGAQLALAHILGADGLNLVLHGFLGNPPADEPERAACLRAWHPVCDWLQSEFAGLRPLGIGLPWDPGMSRRVHTDGSGRWGSLEVPTRGWVGWLAGAGLPCTGRPGHQVNALAGSLAWCFDDDQLLDWLAHGCLLDGPAAHILCERGLGQLIGLEAATLVAREDLHCAMEQYRDCLPAAETGRRATLNLGPFADRLLRFEPAAGAAVVSDLVDAHGCTVGPGALIYGNRLGGRVALVPWTAAAEPVLNVHRARWLREQIGHLAPGGGCGGVDGAPWLVPQFLSDGERGRGVVWNLSPDAVTAFNLETPAGMPLPRVAVQVAADASRRPARVDGGRVIMDQPLQQWEFVVVS